MAFPVSSSEAMHLEKVLALLGADDESKSEADASDADAAEAGEMPGIIQGARSVRSEFPYFVQAEGDGCGATLVAKDVVMSAAHCKGQYGTPRPVQCSLVRMCACASTLLFSPDIYTSRGVRGEGPRGGHTAGEPPKAGPSGGP